MWIPIQWRILNCKCNYNLKHTNTTNQTDRFPQKLSRNHGFKFWYTLAIFFVGLPDMILWILLYLPVLLILIWPILTILILKIMADIDTDNTNTEILNHCRNPEFPITSNQMQPPFPSKIKQESWFKILIYIGNILCCVFRYLIWFYESYSICRHWWYWWPILTILILKNHRLILIRVIPNTKILNHGRNPEFPITKNKCNQMQPLVFEEMHVNCPLFFWCECFLNRETLT